MPPPTTTRSKLLSSRLDEAEEELKDLAATWLTHRFLITCHDLKAVAIDAEVVVVIILELGALLLLLLLLS